MANVLGLHCGHDGSACVVRDGRLTAALSCERITRHKKCLGVTQGLIDYVLRASELTLDQIDCIGISDWHPQWSDPITVSKFGNSVGCLWNTIFDNHVEHLDVVIGGRTFKGYHIGHHLSHCSAAFYTSGFGRAICFSLDASGAKLASNSLVARGDGNKMEALYCPGLMVGCAYGYFTEQLGIGPQIFKAGATMGLAAHGHVDQRVKDSAERYIGGAFKSRDSEHHRWMDDLWNDLSGGSGGFRHEDSDKDRAMNIAAMIQFIFEESILRAIDQAPDAGVDSNLCLGGGSMLNCNANSIIARRSKFKHLHLFPACSDDGCSVGSALYVAHHILNDPRAEYSDAGLAYLGPERQSKQPDISGIARAIADGKIVAWCNGRSEFGPRALGSRSILADPRNAGHRTKINSVLKRREWYRPLAPSIMDEHALSWFGLSQSSPFMLFTAPTLQSDVVPAVNHVDGSARPQTVTEAMNRDFYGLLSEFRSITGVPMLLNTSLNVNGEPLVESSDDAWSLWRTVPVDMIVLDGEITER